MDNSERYRLEVIAKIDALVAELNRQKAGMEEHKGPVCHARLSTPFLFTRFGELLQAHETHCMALSDMFATEQTARVLRETLAGAKKE